MNSLPFQRRWVILLRIGSSAIVAAATIGQVENFRRSFCHSLFGECDMIQSLVLDRKKLSLKPKHRTSGQLDH
ncbi:hypothetical protein ACVWZL_006819 [Bradyrhizobium sp. GM2.4]